MLPLHHARSCLAVSLCVSICRAPAVTATTGPDERSRTSTLLVRSQARSPLRYIRKAAACPCSARPPCARRPNGEDVLAVARTRAPAGPGTPPRSSERGERPLDLVWIRPPPGKAARGAGIEPARAGSKPAALPIRRSSNAAQRKTRVPLTGGSRVPGGCWASVPAPGPSRPGRRALSAGRDRTGGEPPGSRALRRRDNTAPRRRGHCGLATAAGDT